jgi:hypothetical protein
MKFSNFKNKAMQTSYRHGNLYEVGSYVQNVNGEVGKVHRRGPNYVIAITEEGEMFRSWVSDIKEYKQWNKSGDTADHRLVGTDAFRKLTSDMTPGSDYDMWKKPSEVRQRINKTKPVKEETMNTTVRLSAWMLGLNLAEQQEIAAKVDEIILENNTEEKLCEAIDTQFGTERMKDLAAEYIEILSEVKMDGKDDNGFKSCWKGYKKQGTKVKGGKEVNNCVKAGFEAEGEMIEEKKKLDPVGKEDGDVDNDGDKDASDSYLLKKRAAVTAAIKGKTKKEEFSSWRSELSEKAGKYVEVNPKIEDNADPDSVFDKNKKLKHADKAVKEETVSEECGCDSGKEDCGCEKCLAKKASKVKRVKYQDGVNEEVDKKKKEDIVKGMKKNMGDLKARYGEKAKNVMYATATKMAKK